MALVRIFMALLHIYVALLRMCGALLRMYRAMKVGRWMAARVEIWGGYDWLALQIIGLFCRRALQKRLYSTKETYKFKDPTNRSHPIAHPRAWEFLFWVYIFAVLFLSVARPLLSVYSSFWVFAGLCWGYTVLFWLYIYAGLLLSGWRPIYGWLQVAFEGT